MEVVMLGCDYLGEERTFDDRLKNINKFFTTIKPHVEDAVEMATKVKTGTVIGEDGSVVNPSRDRGLPADTDFDWKGNLPYIAAGGVGLLAVVIMVAKRKKRRR